MTILVTGAGGFVGRQIVALLLAQGRPVVALDTQPGALPATPARRPHDGRRDGTARTI